MLLAASLAALLLGAWAVPTGAAADGFEKAPPCTYSAPGAISPPPVYFTTVPGTPYVPHAREFTDSEPEPEGNFSATANWGDGTASPASVRVPPGGCYEVSASSHTYLSPGTYSFSYTVHDAHTGLDHTVGPELFYVLSLLPVPVLTPTPPLIQILVGQSWSGVVGEFGFQPFHVALAAFVATIDWGDGHTSPGVIAANGYASFTVSGSHTYSSLAMVPIKVTVAGGIETGSWITADVLASEAPKASRITAGRFVGEAPKPFRFRGQPILAAMRRRHADTTYEVLFRLDRALPRATSGAVAASLRVHRSTASLVAFGAHLARACYVARLTGFAARSAPARRRYPIRLALQQRTAATVEGQATLRTFSNLAALRLAGRRLGC